LKGRESLGYVLADQGIDGVIILKMDIKEIGCDCVYWIQMAYNRD
jgi:hypothetical protein